MTRKSAFMEQLERYDLLSDPNLIHVGNHKIDGGETAMQRLLVLHNRPTAVLTSNDLTAIGALRRRIEGSRGRVGGWIR